MEKIIAKCGIVCSDCPAYIATKKDDDVMRNQVAKEWTEMFKHPFKAEDINCDSCLTETGRLCSYCKTLCEIRPCALEKNAANCAHCSEYSCSKLDSFLSMVPDARSVLEGVRSGK